MQHLPLPIQPTYDLLGQLPRVSWLSVLSRSWIISNPARPTAVAVPWAKRIQEEFWAQGDLMREQEMPVPTMNDRAHAAENITHEARLQTGFTLGLVKPLFDLVNGIAGVDLTVPLQNIQKNLSVYAKLKDANLPMTMENIASVSPAVTAET